MERYKPSFILQQEVATRNLRWWWRMLEKLDLVIFFLASFGLVSMIFVLFWLACWL